MIRKDELLAGFDDVWNHRWESFEVTLKDITEEEANFQHEAYRDAEPYPDEPPAGTIMWHLIHFAQCYEHYTNMIKARPVRPEDPPPPQASSFDEGLALVRRNREVLRAAIDGVRDDALDEKVGNGDTVAMFVRMITRHDAWHLGQIAVARRLYRTRPI